MTQTTIGYACERCSQPLAPGALVCSRCGELIYRRHLEGFSAEAARLEAVNPAAAALAWRRCLDFLPVNSEPYHAIYNRIGALAAGINRGGGPTHAAGPSNAHAYGGDAGGWAPQGPAPYRPARRQPRPNDSLPLAVAKTGGSMLLSILAYMLVVQSDSLATRFQFAFGFVVLILVHELGHSLAMWYYGLSASPPIFIPFMGALINMRQAPPDAKVEAVVGIGGPVLGTIGAVACYALAVLATPAGSDHREMLLMIASIGFYLNLFNLLPVPPLDGGRVTAAISPRIWLLGVAFLVVYAAQQLLTGGSAFMLLLILAFALPRVIGTLRNPAARTGPYYAITRGASWAIAAVYLGLGAVLSFFVWLARTEGWSVLG
jgi:Zn-dependent protease